MASASEPHAQSVAGYDRLDVRADHRADLLAASVWYPVGTPTYRGLIGDNPVFRGTPVFVGAGIAEGRHPLVLLSHGSGGNMDSLGWLASGLVEDGAMVLAVNHPGSTSGDSSPRRSLRLAERAADLGAALDALLADPAFAPFVDPGRIAALGFSLGGATALNLAGMRLDADAYADYCEALDGRALDCLFFARGGVDLRALPASFEADMRDPRITSAIAVDPAFTYAASGESLAAMTLPVLLISLGDGEDRLPAGDVGPDGSDLTGKLPDVRHEVIAPASHFTFLAPCKPAGSAILAEEAEDPVCDDPPGTRREQVHRAIVDRVAAFLGL